MLVCVGHDDRKKKDVEQCSHSTIEEVYLGRLPNLEHTKKGTQKCRRHERHHEKCIFIYFFFGLNSCLNFFVSSTPANEKEKNKNRSTCLDKTARRQLADWIGFDGGQREAVHGHFGKALCFLPVGLRGGGRERKGPLAWFSPALPVRPSVSSRTSTVQELRVALPFHFPPTKKKVSCGS